MDKKTMYKKIALTVIAIVAMLLLPYFAKAARTDSEWNLRLGTYLETTSPIGYDILINGISKYLNFGSVSGSSGYGFRDNSGTIQFKHNGGAWADVGSGGGGGGSTALDLGDDGANESSGLTEIATTGDTNSIFSEPSADKLLIAVGNDWPKADTADDLTCTDCIGTTEIADSYVLNTGDTVTGDLYVNALLQVGNAATSGGEIRIYEDTDNGSNFLSFLAPTSIGSDRTCQLANLSAFIPDSCVGNGTDDTGITSVSWGDIIGTLSSQTDLQTALDEKQTNLLSDGRFWLGDGSGFAAEAALSGDVTMDNTGVTSIGNDKVVEADLKAVDAAGDEECLTYESTVGDFEWQTCGGGSFDSTTVDATTWSDGANASNIWTFDLSGTDTTLTFGSGLFTFGGAVTASGKVIADASLDIKNGATSSGILAIFEDSDNGTNKATFQVPSLAADTVYTLPADDGDSGEFLQTNGSGVLDWVASAGSGDITSVGDVASGAAFDGTQGTILTFNDAGGDATLEYDNANNWFEISSIFNPATDDGATLGNATQRWSDLFLAEGAVINWDNGDATLTQTSNDITFGGITTFGLGTSTALTTGTIELGAASDTTIARASAGQANLEGVAIATASNTLTLTNKTIASASNVLDSCLMVAVTDEYSNLTTGTAKVSFHMPYAMTVTSVRGNLVTAATGATLVAVDINEAGTTILSTKITLDASETTSTTAATAPVISDSSLADDALMTVDIDAIGNTTPGNGLKIQLCGTI